MSYCRFSSDNFRSDVYVYAHYCGHWQIEVACRKRLIPPIPDVPLHRLPSFGGTYSHEDRMMLYPTRPRRVAANVMSWLWLRWHKLHMWSVGISPLRDIGLEHDGATFCEDSPGDCAARLELLRALGYHVPKYAIDALREEQVELDAA